MNIFSKQTPTMRLVWDATSLDAFMRDPLSYYWKYVEGWRAREPSIDLLWGTAWDKAMAYYHHNRAADRSRESVLHDTLEFAINHASEVDLDEVAAESKTKHNKKNLATLIRSIVWYDAEHGDYDLYEPDISQPTRIQLPFGRSSLTDEDRYLIANYDQIVRDRETGKRLVVERKTTTQTIGQHYWLSYDPSVQLNTYAYTAFMDTSDIVGVFIEACQTAVGFTRFDHHEVLRTTQQHKQWKRVMRWWMHLAEAIAVTNEWELAMNLGTQKWESTTRNIQRRSPAVWDGLLRTNFEKREPWNPLEVK